MYLAHIAKFFFNFSKTEQSVPLLDGEYLDGGESSASLKKTVNAIKPRTDYEL